MKVKCIATSWISLNVFYRRHWWSKKERKPAKGPAMNDIVTVSNDRWVEGIKFYELVEWPGEAYTSRSFIPIEEQYEQIKFSQIKEKASVN